MNKLTLIICLLIGGICLAQELPEITPPSPDVFALTKYGGNEINESSGSLSLQVPLYNYKAGQLNLPISMSYSGTGVKVNELSSWTGINWTLQAGGVISRTVKDNPDEYTANRLSFTTQEYQNMNLTDGSADAAFLNGALDYNASQYDTESDIFSFSFVGGSGSFFLDENFEPVLTKKDRELKIEIPGTYATNRENLLNNKQFIITTPDGVKYYFGGTNATEDSNTFLGVSGQNNPTATSGFYLTEIEHPVNGRIFFEYLNNVTANIYTLYKEDYIHRLAGTSHIVMNCPPPDWHLKGVTRAVVNNRVHNPKSLSRIYSYNNALEVMFNSSTVQNANIKRILNSIDVVYTSSIYNKIDFNYLVDSDLTTTPRFFLETIEFDNDKTANNNQAKKEYTFEYDDALGLPDLHSFDQDHMGYFNGKNNTTLIPDNYRSNPYNDTNSGFADRSPDFNFSKKGSLTKVNYPTGGYTTFEYEAPPVKEAEYENIHLYAYRNIANRIPIDNLYDGVPQVLANGSILFNVPIIEDQDVTLSLSLTAQSEVNGVNYYTNPQEENVVLTITDLFSNTVSTHTTSLATDTYSKTKDYVLNLLAGRNYKVEIDIDPAQGDNTATPFEVHANFQYLKGYNIVEGNGIRVKKQIDFSASNSSSNIKRYYYNKIDEIPTIDDLNFIKTPTYISGDYHQQCCVVQHLGASAPSFYDETTFFHKISSKSDVSFYATTNGVPTYQYVSVSYGGDNYELGGKESLYTSFHNLGPIKLITAAGVNPHSGITDGFDPSLEFTSSLGNISVLNGLLLEEKVYKKENTGLFKISNSKNIYNNSAFKVKSNLVGKRLFYMCQYEPGTGADNVISNFGLGLYENFGYKNNLINRESISYIDPVPLSVTDESNYKKVVTTVDYTYDELAGLPKTTTQSTSDGDILKTVNFYPVSVDINNMSGLTSAEALAYIKLTTANRVASPIQTESYIIKNNQDVLLSTTRTIYKDWSLDSNWGGNNVLPLNVLTSKGNNSLENRINFLKYDLYGNLLEVSKQNGTKTGYLWTNGLNNLLLAKIENINSYETMPQNVTTSNNCLDASGNVIFCDNTREQYPDLNITSFNYVPIINLLKDVTDPRGYTMHYEYDDFYRLEYVKDQDGNILSKNEYNYAFLNQN